jgi:uncharacterized protein YgfB (UPF0149 family)
MNALSYPDFQRALTLSNALSDAAEAHGTLSGALCAAVPYTLEDWLAEILPDGRAPAAQVDGLREVFEATRAALLGGEMEFQLLLPQDEAALSDRTGALGEWCHGFLYGLGTGHVQNLDSLEGEVSEIIRDLTEITHVDIDPQDSEDSNESAYAELVEFVRVGVQLLFEQLEPLRHVPRPTDAPLH